MSPRDLIDTLLSRGHAPEMADGVRLTLDARDSRRANPSTDSIVKSRTPRADRPVDIHLSQLLHPGIDDGLAVS
jgi:hypothetical protein